MVKLADTTLYSLPPQKNISLQPLNKFLEKKPVNNLLQQSYPSETVQLIPTFLHPCKGPGRWCSARFVFRGFHVQSRGCCAVNPHCDTFFPMVFPLYVQKHVVWCSIPSVFLFFKDSELAEKHHSSRSLNMLKLTESFQWRHILRS